MAEEIKRGVSNLVRGVFERAKQTDEFEFAAAIIPLVRGLAPYGPDDPLRETEMFVKDMLGLMNAPLEYMTRIRLGLIAYVHMMECKPVYEELSNILWIIAGYQAIPEPFEHLYKGIEKRPPSAKRVKGIEKCPPCAKRVKGIEKRPPSAKRVIDFLACQARGVDEPGLADEIEGMFDDAVRNAIAHSDYFFHDDRFQTDSRRKANPSRLVNGIPLDELREIMLRGADFFDAMRNASESHRRSYTRPKLVMARTTRNDERAVAVLLANEEHGLYGIDGKPNHRLVEECLAYENHRDTSSEEI